MCSCLTQRGRGHGGVHKTSPQVSLWGRAEEHAGEEDMHWDVSQMEECMSVRVGGA